MWLGSKSSSLIIVCVHLFQKINLACNVLNYRTANTKEFIIGRLAKGEILAWIYWGFA
jgi:hypothetical protein